MERSEPTLVPEWLRSTASVSGGGSSAPHVASSSSSNSDALSSSHHTRNANSTRTINLDPSRSSFLDWASSSKPRKNSSNGSAKHAYSSFSSSHRSRDQERDKERSSIGDHWDREFSDRSGSILGSKGEKDMLHRSYSMMSQKQGELFPRRVASDLRNENSSSRLNGTGLIPVGGIGKSSKKAGFDKNFPSLGSEEKQGMPYAGRVSSPGLSTAVQSLPILSSALISREGWTSALAEVPSSSSTTGPISTTQTVPASVSEAASAVTSLNMADVLNQAPPKTQTAPQLAVQTQRLEELVIRRSRQLIPVTPSIPKNSILNSSNKSKTKTMVRSSEMNMASKSMQQQQQSSSLHAGNQSVNGGNEKSDGPKTSLGKLYVLKLGRNNVLSTSPEDVAGSSDTSTKVANGLLAVPCSVSSTSPRSPKNPKRPLSQTQSRSDFFNLLKKKTLSSNPADSSAVIVSSPTTEKASEVNREMGDDSHFIKNGVELTINGGESEEVQRFSKEEAAFLRSLGWEENSGEDEGLTEEEINAFIQQYMKLKPSLKVCRGVQKKLESHCTSLAGPSSEWSASKSSSKA